MRLHKRNKILIWTLIIFIFFVYTIRKNFSTNDSQVEGENEPSNFIDQPNDRSIVVNKWIPPKLNILKKRIGDQSSIIDRSTINREQNQKGQQWCRFPDLKIDAPEIRKFFKNPDPLECSKVEKNWITIKNSTFYIDPEAIERHGGGEILCDYTNYWRITDSKLNSKLEKNFKSGTKLKGDFFRTSCRSTSDNAVYENVHAGIVADPAALDRATNRKLVESKDALNLNVYMAGFDSLSRLTFMRKLPKLYKFLIDRMQSIVLEGYNIVGDGTPQALIPILTGRTESELPSTRKRDRNADYVNIYPFVWNDYRNSGYVTLYGEDAALVGTFTYRLKGFKEQPTDHYMRTFYQLAEPEMKKNKDYCWGSEEHHKTHFGYVEQFWQAYPSPIRKFAFQFHSVLSHHDVTYDLINVADDYMVEHMKFFVDRGHMNDTILIFMSDHGHRFASLRETQQGKLEERLPFFSFAFPPWFAKKYPDHIRNFKRNAHRLTTPFDIYATLKNILNFDPISKLGDLKSRGLSLFDEIPIERTCSDADIAPQWCTCLNWIEIDTIDPIVKFIADRLIVAINEETAHERNLCSPIKLNKIEKASKYSPDSALLSFKGSKDIDGLKPDLSGNATVQIEYYQLTFWTDPGDAHYEASATYEKLKNKLSIDFDSVQHVNKFGDLPHCIIDKDYFLAKWCVCYDKI